MPMKSLRYDVLPADAGRLDILLARLLTYPRSRVRGLLDHEGVRVNGNECRDSGYFLQEGDRLELRYDTLRKYKEKPPERKPQGFQLVYKDEHLVIVNKNAGILTVPTNRREDNTLVDRLSRYLAAGKPRAPHVAVVHRLDRETSGLLVFGQRSGVAQHLIQQFAARKPEREYIAIVAGSLSQDEGEIRSLLQTDKALNQRSAQMGELAITHYRVVKRFADATMIAVNLETGRRNQIRVHFAEMGHPVLGDERYEAEKAAHPAWPHRRLALHARLLGFTHPITTEALRFEAEIPDEFKNFRSTRS